MFKKAFTINLRNTVSGADRKKLRRSIDKAYTHLSDDDIDAVLPSKAGELEQLKLAAPSRSVIYLLDKVPILIDPSGKGDIVPTVFALWRVPHFLPRVFIKHAAVSSYMVGGADLMLPGVHVPPDGLPAFQKDDLVSVCVYGNPAPLAVGSAVLASVDIKEKANSKGKLVELVQHYGDCLWADLGAKAVPNPGFVATAVLPLGYVTVEQTLQGEHSFPAAANGQEPPLQNPPAAVAASVAAAVAAEVATSPPSNSAGESAAGTSTLEVPEVASGGAAVGMAGLAPGPTTSVTTSEHSDMTAGPCAASSDGPGWPPSDMDALLELCLLQALHRSLEDADLPVNSNVLWTQVKEDRNSGDMVVTAVHRQHTLYANYKPYKAALQDNAAPGDGAAGGAAAGGDSGAGGPSGSNLVVEELYKPTKETKPLFAALNLDCDALYSAQEAGNAVFAYVDLARLEVNAPDASSVVLDTLLCDALYKGVVKKGEMFPCHQSKATLRDALVSRMQVQCRICRGGEQVLKKGSSPLVQVSKEKHRGHTVTRIVGVEQFLIDAKQFGSECQRKFACSTTVSDLPGKHGGQEILIQGDVIKHLGEYLTQAWHIPGKYIQGAGSEKRSDGKK